MAQLEKVLVFLASPGDVQAERQQAREVIEDINRTLGRDANLHLDVIGWETDAIPAYGGDAQNLLNSQIADMESYDLFVGIMWNRLGQPTPRAGSGTEEEFDRAVEAFGRRGRPHIMFYFSQAPANLATSEQVEQKGKVLQFRKKVQTGGLTRDYNDAQEFRALFQSHLSTWLLNRTHASPKPPPVTVLAAPSPPCSAVPVPPATDYRDWIFLSNAFFQAESVLRRGDGTVTIRIVPTSGDDKALLDSLRPQRYRNAGEVGYAYQDEAAIARVEDVLTESAAGKTTYVLTLKDDERLQGGGLSEVSYNGISADEMAVMRARLILLNEEPPARLRTGTLSIMHFINGFDSVVKVEKGILARLWQQFGQSPELFQPLARLVAVYHLRLSRTVEHVLELDLGPVANDRMHVKFRGQRQRAYTNVSPTLIELDGEYNLSV